MSADVNPHSPARARDVITPPTPKKPRHRRTKTTSVWLGVQLVRDVDAEAQRLKRSMSWVVMRCVRLAMRHIRELPGLETRETS